MDAVLPLIYDYGTSGRRVSSFSIPVVLGTGLLMLVLGVGTLPLFPRTSTNFLYALFLVGMGGWMSLYGLHLRRDRYVFSTRYVLSDIGVEITPADSSRQSVSWSEFTSGHQSRVLRYFRLASPALNPDVVLTFGAPPKSQMTGQPKYQQTRNLLEEKLGDRFLKGWL
jgi:hypothetical protein